MSTFVTSHAHCAEKIVSARLRAGSASAERVGGVTPQGDVHMLAVVAVCRNALAGTGRSNSCLVCTNRLRKHCSHLVGSSFLAVKAFSALNGCLLAENAD